MLIGVIGISDEAGDLIGFDSKVRPMIQMTLGVALSWCGLCRHAAAPGSVTIPYHLLYNGVFVLTTVHVCNGRMF